jgi:hypothetical protein
MGGHAAAVVWSMLKRRPDMLSALTVATAAGLVVLAYRSSKVQRHEVEHFYHRRHRPLYHLIQLCNMTLMAAFAFNGRFVAIQILSWLAAKVSAAAAVAA